ncbi:AAA family ATPase [Tranquillimonas alkanivorans]|uniref:Uncharacterized protein n=1 Tax=Tranquillimonas alkanivorans TaxID=441119 RepID=A0A1I5WKH8_9RHOB|nr:bifunctional aminoglycoside phosphotransferase/ATP-binding protein [Tranquillimonas alkanivorans]SFQ20219.1 hypothetical protein SAMN04488047_1492 [Tranquillimonas alkanivorans]
MVNEPPHDQHEVVAFLRSGAAHGGVAPVEVIETHGALVFLAGETALKIKRAVRYDYMDLSTIDRREAMLRRELDLNRPRAPMIYRDVVPVTREDNGELALGGSGPPVEWALRMWRFPKSAELAEIAAQGALDDTLATALGRAIQAYHAACPRRDAAGGALIGEILDELDRVFDGMPDALNAESVRRFHDLSRQGHGRLSGFLDARTVAGRVRRAHGDLHLHNIVLYEGRPVPFDALEFDETLGTCDVLYDLAFLLMDLWHRRLRVAANAVLGSYLLSADGAEDAGVRTLPLFQAVRAAIRAMTTVQTARATGKDGPVTEAGSYLDLACDLLTPAPARLVAVGGVSGTGKTVLARMLSPGLGAPPGAVHLRTDTERKAMLSAPEDARLPQAAYTTDGRARVYRRLYDRAGNLLAAGHSVVFDATFLDPEDRARVEEIARSNGAAFTGLWLAAPEATLVNRVSARSGDASDANAQVVRAQLAVSADGSGWLRVDAAGTPDQTLARAKALLSD